MNEPFNKYMAEPMQSVPICVLNTKCSPPLPIIQFKRSDQSLITAATMFHHLTTRKLHYKKCKEGMYVIMTDMMNQYQTNNFIEMNEEITIDEIMKTLIPLKSGSKIYWLKLKVNLTTHQIGNDKTFNGIYMEGLIAKRPKQHRKGNSSKKTGLKYFLKLFVHPSKILRLTNQEENQLYKLGYDFGEEIKNKYNVALSDWTYGFYYVNKSESMGLIEANWKYDGVSQNNMVELSKDYIDYKRKTKPIESIENFIRSKRIKFMSNNIRFYHGSLRYKNAITEKIANETYSEARKTFQDPPNFWHIESSKNRVKGFGIMKYAWNSKHSEVAANLSDSQKKRMEKVAGGLRYWLNEPKDRKIPSFITNLIPCMISIGAWSKENEIGQVAANIYYNSSEKPAYAFLDPHNEYNKFTHLTAIYINSSPEIKTGCAINLKSNVGNGVVLVDTNHLEIIKWDS